MSGGGRGGGYDEFGDPIPTTEPSDLGTADPPTTTTTTTGGSAPQTGAGDPGDVFPDTTKSGAFSVPADLEQPLRDAAAQYGIPYWTVLAAAVHAKTKFAKTKVSLAVIDQMAQRLQRAFQAAIGSRGLPAAAQQDPTTLQDLWTTAAARAAGVSKDAFASLYETAPSISAELGFGSGVGTAPLIPGLSDNAAYAVQRIADSLYLQYLGRVPTNAEYINVSKAGWTTDVLETWLRAQPHPGGGTVGQFNDVQTLARKYAAQYLGHGDADPGQVAYLIANGLTTADQVDAYYNQLKERVDTGDPAFAWAADPATWRNTEAQFQSLWQKAGLTGIVDPHLVNQAVGGRWSLDQIQQAIDNTPAPGYAQGVTVGQVNHIKPIALGYKSTIGGGDPAPLTPTEIAQFLGMNPMQIREYYRSLPAMGKTVPSAAGTAQQPPEQPVTTTTAPPPSTAKPATQPGPKTQIEGAPAPTWTPETKKFNEPFGSLGSRFGDLGRQGAP